LNGAPKEKEEVEERHKGPWGIAALWCGSQHTVWRNHMSNSRTFAVVGALALTVASVGAVSAQDAMDPGAAAGAKIIVNMKGPGGGNPFWAAVQKGAEEAGAAYGVEVIVGSPPAESDVQSQISQIEDAITQGVSGIAMAPTDPAALAVAVDAATAAGIPVVFIDTKGSNEGITFIGTDNEAGAALAAKYLCDNLEAGAKVAILQGIVTQSTGQARAEGSKAGLEACGLTIVAELPANWDTAEAQTVTEDILTGNPDIAGIFASNDNMALGAVEAVKAQGLLDQVTIVGFDANPNAATAILAGDMEATIAQNPSNMGKFGVESIIKLINGETLEPVIDTGTELVTAENAANYTE
jgi:ribose transport system substrate-binding protein